MKKKIIKRISYLLLTGFIVTNSSGCSNESVINNQAEGNNDFDIEQDNTQNQLDLEKDIMDSEQVNKENLEVESEKVEEVNTEQVNQIEEVTEVEKYDDEDIINYFSTKKDDIVTCEKSNVIKQRAIDLFIEMTDFIFYGEEIHGITYKELKDATKENIIGTFGEIDRFICSIDPDYKETLQEKYKIVSEFISENYKNGKESFLENYGDITINDIYNEMQEIKESDKETINQVKDASLDTYENAKTKVKQWYENLKNNN